MLFSLSFELNEVNAAGYLGRLTGRRPSRVTALSGGVSNTVLLAEFDDGQRLVLKQSLPRLRVEQEWLCDRSRILRECSALRVLAPRLTPGSVPEVMFEDQENFAFAMASAPPSSETWKTQLLRGETDPATALRAGTLLASVIRETSGDPQLRQTFGDLEAFEQLRLDPYYQVTASRHPEKASFFAELIGECRRRAVCLVHGDWSPKNFLVTPGSVMAIDWECVHYGNPAFDAAFGLNHLLLKSFHLPSRETDFATLAAAFWSPLRTALPELYWLEESTVRHLAGLLLARMDGKSPVEYITDPAAKDRIRTFALELMREPPATIDEVFDRRALCH
jgi:5-methylthioribose kinase